jgi:thioredoxin 1
MVPIVTQLATDFDGRALVGSVDVREQATLADRYAVVATPTFVYFRSGREVERKVGATTYQDLARTLRTLLGPP